MLKWISCLLWKHDYKVILFLDKDNKPESKAIMCEHCGIINRRQKFNIIANDDVEMWDAI